jgi:hypothetical protein
VKNLKLPAPPITEQARPAGEGNFCCLGLVGGSAAAHLRISSALSESLNAMEATEGMLHAELEHTKNEEGPTTRTIHRTHRLSVGARVGVSLWPRGLAAGRRGSLESNRLCGRLMPSRHVT